MCCEDYRIGDHIKCTVKSFALTIGVESVILPRNPLRVFAIFHVGSATDAFFRPSLNGQNGSADNAFVTNIDLPPIEVRKDKHGELCTVEWRAVSTAAITVFVTEGSMPEEICGKGKL